MNGSENIIFGASLIAGFIGGIVALFAPCCITFLLPSYLAQILKVRSRILLGTAIFGLGIATIMVPVTLGFWALVSLFSGFHTTTYVTGGLFMIVLGVISLWGYKMNMPSWLSPKLKSKADMFSLYVLGLFSGLTSVCCAPVLAGALTLGALSPTLPKSILVSLSYVSGIVFPLFLGAFVFERDFLMKFRQFLSKKLSLLWLGIDKEISLGNVLSSVMFVGVGVALVILALSGNIQMPESAAKITQIIGSLSLWISGFTKNNPWIEYGFLGLILLTLGFFLMMVIKERARYNETQNQENHSCHKKDIDPLDKEK